MSAFVVSDDHIDGLMTFAVDYKVSYYDPIIKRQVYVDKDNASDVGEMLLGENRRMVAVRYKEPIGSEPHYRWRSIEILRLMPRKDLVATILKACDCYEYQTFETDDYDGMSTALRVITAIREDVVRRLPGYADAPGWELTRVKLATWYKNQQKRAFSTSEGT